MAFPKTDFVYNSLFSNKSICQNTVDIILNILNRSHVLLPKQQNIRKYLTHSSDFIYAFTLRTNAIKTFILAASVEQIGQIRSVKPS